MSLICDFDREIEEQAKADDRVEVLCQIRGVGRYTAMLIIAEVGDINRFPTARQLCSWAGLTPSVRSSDGKARLGHVSRQGSPALRWALVEAAQKITTDRALCASSTSGSPSAAGARSPRSLSPARSSPSATTACATERSVAWRAAAARARKNSWRPSHEHRRALTQQGLRPRRRRDAHDRASSTLVMASLAQHGRRLDRAPEHRTTLWSAPRDRIDDRSSFPSRNAVSQPAPKPPSPISDTRPDQCQTQPAASSAPGRQRPLPATHALDPAGRARQQDNQARGRAPEPPSPTQRSRRDRPHPSTNPQPNVRNGHPPLDIPAPSWMTRIAPYQGHE
jgi:hypothetical protein